jgi:hypothetical protein
MREVYERVIGNCKAKKLPALKNRPGDGIELHGLPAYLRIGPDNSEGNFFSAKGPSRDFARIPELRRQ